MSMLMFESAFPVAASSVAPVVARTRTGGRRHNAAATNTVKEYAQMTTAEKRLFNLEKARAARRTTAPASPAPAKAPKAEKAEKAEKAAYVRTAIKLTNYGHGCRETVIDGVKVGIAWDGKTSTFVYVIGRKVAGAAADRGAAVAQLNVALAARGLPPVRA